MKNLKIGERAVIIKGELIDWTGEIIEKDEVNNAVTLMIDLHTRVIISGDNVESC